MEEAFDKKKVKEAIRQDIVNAYHDRNGNPDLYSNTLDIFGAVIDSKLLRINLEKWREIEIPRQTQKTVQNTFGRLHQTIIGTVPGWEDVGKNGIVDVINCDRKIIAEIKNKHNTVTGGLRKTNYETLKKSIETRYKGFTSYFVEILPKNRKVYNVPFTPSDNTLKLDSPHQSSQKPINDYIRMIDGKSFYHLVTGKEDAVRQLFKILPIIVDEILCEEAIIDANAKFDLDEVLADEFYSKTFL